MSYSSSTGGAENPAPVSAARVSDGLKPEEKKEKKEKKTIPKKKTMPAPGPISAKRKRETAEADARYLERQRLLSICGSETDEYYTSDDQDSVSDSEDAIHIDKSSLKPVLSNATLMEVNCKRTKFLQGIKNVYDDSFTRIKREMCELQDKWARNEQRLRTHNLHKLHNRRKRTEAWKKEAREWQEQCEKLSVKVAAFMTAHGLSKQWAEFPPQEIQ